MLEVFFLKFAIRKPFFFYIFSTEAQTVTGWSDSIEKYWEDYSARGGFEAVISRFGICAQSKKEASEFSDSVYDCHPGIPKPVRPTG